MTAMTRGPLPARIYWTRRILALVVVSGLIAATVQLVSLAAGGDDEPPGQVAQVAADPDPAETPDADATEPAAEPRGEPRGQRDKKRDTGPDLALPEGPCTDRDIAVTPTAEKTVGGSPITFVLELRTILAPACTWEVSPQSLTVKITSGDDDIWFSSQCPRAIPREDVVVRNNVSTEVEVTWSARRSDDECSRLPAYAMPGWYHIEAAALAGEPSDLQFQLTAPEPDVVTETVDPEPKRGEGKKREQVERGRD